MPDGPRTDPTDPLGPRPRGLAPPPAPAPAGGLGVVAAGPAGRPRRRGGPAGARHAWQAPPNCPPRRAPSTGSGPRPTPPAAPAGTPGSGAAGLDDLDAAAGLRRPHQRRPRRRRRLAQPGPLPRLARPERRGHRLPRPRRLAARRRRPRPRRRRLDPRRSPPPGAGAEALADDFRYAWVVDGSRRPGLAADLVGRWPDLVPVEMPPTRSPAPRRSTRAGSSNGSTARPPPGSVPDRRRRPAPRARHGHPHARRCSGSPAPTRPGFAVLDDPAFAEVAPRPRRRPPREDARCRSPGPTPRSARSASPRGLDDADEGVADPRRSSSTTSKTSGSTSPASRSAASRPLEAGRGPRRGATWSARAKLAAVVRYREQLGARPTHAAVYQGYPFDRLRRRLGLLDADESVAVDADDVSCMSERELDALDPDALDDHRLADAFTSAAALRDDARTARFAALLARPRARGPAPARPGRGLRPAGPRVAPARRPRRGPRLARARRWPARTAPPRRTFTVWSAEILARTGRPDAALARYQDAPRPPRRRRRPGPRRRRDPARQRLPRSGPPAPPRSPRRAPAGRATARPSARAESAPRAAPGRADVRRRRPVRRCDDRRWRPDFGSLYSARRRG